VTTTGGTKSLKKLFLEERIPRSRRATLPVLTDATGRVLWVAGIERDLLTVPRGDELAFSLTIVND
jgi:tRNA(Ile)-lysidine synthase